MEWISVKDKMPELDESYKMSDLLLVTDSEVVGVGYYVKYDIKHEWRIYPTNMIIDVTHWMPLPEPPKE